MDQNKAMALVASGLAVSQMTVGDADTTGWVWEYFEYEGVWFAVRYAGVMAIAVEIFEGWTDTQEHIDGWTAAEDRALGLDDGGDADDSEFVYDDVEA